jgi:hypothetical protein
MTFFIGAKNLDGQVIVAEMIDADDFHSALAQLMDRAVDKVGRGNFRVTAVNEQLFDSARPAVAEFLDQPSREATARQGGARS